MNIWNISLMLIQFSSSAPYSIIVIQEVGPGKPGCDTEISKIVILEKQ